MELTKKHILGGLLMGTIAGVTAGVVAGVTLRFTYDKLIKEQQMHKKLKSISHKVSKRHDKCFII